MGEVRRSPYTDKTEGDLHKGWGDEKKLRLKTATRII